MASPPDGEHLKETNLMTATASLQDLYLEDLKDIYNAENQAIKAYPKLMESVTHPELKEAMQLHLEQTQEHVSRLEQIFDKLGEKPTGKTCKAMNGLVKEGEDILKEQSDPFVRDAALLAASQKIEHYEIASYGTVITYAEQIGDEEAVSLLKKTLNEEKHTDKILSKLAESVINQDANKG